jgi:hypothetical protein
MCVSGAMGEFGEDEQSLHLQTSAPSSIPSRLLQPHFCLYFHVGIVPTMFFGEKGMLFKKKKKKTFTNIWQMRK